MGLWTSKSVVAVQSILRYEFKNKSLLEQALTHSSYTDSESYERLEFVGDAVIDLAVAKLLFVTYPDLDPGWLSILREENVSREKLARVTVRRGLYKHMNHSDPVLKLQVEEFVSSIKEEGDEIFPYGRGMKAPKVLSDLVESVAAAVYVDCGFNLELMWKCISPLLEPFVTLKNIDKHPVGILNELCQKMKKKLEFEFSIETPKFVCSVMVDRTLVSQSSSDQMKIAKLTAAKKALPEIAKLNGAKEVLLKMNMTKLKMNMTKLNMNMTGTSSPSMDIDGPLAIIEEVEGAKQELNKCRRIFLLFFCFWVLIREEAGNYIW